MIGELFINGYDAFAAWGATLGDGSLSALMSPAPLKQYVSNESPLSHGKSVVGLPIAMPKVNSRDVQLTIYIHANSAETFISKYAAFVQMLQMGKVDVSTRYQPGVTYKLLYLSCSQFSQFNGRLAKFAVKFNEPNPMDRC